MSFIHIAAFLGSILFLYCLIRLSADDGTEKNFRSLSFLTAALFLSAFLVRLILSGSGTGFNVDFNCFASWADRIYRTGPGNFYSSDVFTDYPPGYMYLLWPIGALTDLLHIEYGSAAHLILLKLPSVLSDLACGYLLYRTAVRKCSRSQAFLLCAAYLFNPAVILNSSVWGQVDSIFTLCLAGMVLALVKGRPVPAYAAFFAALLLKPQALFLAPILILGVLDQVIFRDFSAVNLLRNLAYAVMIFCGAALLCAPFGLNNVWTQYFSTISSYPYASVNAYNLWAMAGFNWVSQDSTFMGLPCYVYGYAAIAAATAAVFMLGFKRRNDREKYPVLSAVLLVSIFMFSVRMHERYLYPAMFFLLLAYLYRPSFKLFFCYAGFSLLHFYNTAHVLWYYDPSDYDRHNPVFAVIGAGMLLMTLYLYWSVYRLYGCDGAADWSKNSPGRGLPPLFARRTSPVPRPSVRAVRLTLVDLICMLAVTALYSCFALHDLGDTQVPETAYQMTQNQSLVLDFGEKIPRTLSYYMAPEHNRIFTLEGKRDAGDEWVYLGDITLENVFTWQEAAIEAGVSHLRLTLQDTRASLLELVFLDEDGRPILPADTESYAALFDEQDLFPEYYSFRNGMYFDEIYHARTAYEFIHGLYSYENTHPPLGKILIAAGVRIFGMNPFGWRIVGVLFGIAMVPLVYLFAKRVTSYSPAALLACVAYAFDFMHFTQTRIATIDVYITFFVILMYYFMYRYSCLSFYDTPLVRTLIPLGACGICMGLGIAVKWTGFYAGAGLAVIFFCTLYRRYREYLWAKQTDRPAGGSISPESVRQRFVPYTKWTILFCLVFFVAIPACIYLLSYLPFRDYTEDGLLLRMLRNQKSMFQYHSGLEATHPYASPWYQWPLIVRPIWYFSGLPGGNLREGISAFGNPLVWWAGIPAFFYMVWLWAREKDRTAAFLTVGYLAQYLPWVFVTRITFIYHYFPSVIFLVLMIAHGFMQLKTKVSDRRFLCILALYGTAVIGLFLLFYPVLSGQPVDADFVDRWLRWFDSWVLTAR